MIKEGQKYIITTEGWFYAPDGKKYKAVWGAVELLPDAVLGVKTNKGSTNWYAKVGSEEKHVIVAGCQIHYASHSEEAPNMWSVEEHLYDISNGTKKFFRPNEIYIAE
jgi:hypothetical protein